jgi:EmrB/QacA subfamily drug resistance transporter
VTQGISKRSLLSSVPEHSLARSAGAVSPARPSRRVPAWAVLAICCVAQFMLVLDISIVNVALPQMRASLGLSVAGEQWVVNAYTLTFAGFLLLGGRAGDLFGRRRVFIAGLAVFTLTSLIGGLAQTGVWLVAARAAQGAGAAFMAPATLSILVTTFTGPDERRRAIGAWSATAASGGAVGVLAGGVLTSLLNWRWVLFVNVPVGIVLLAGAWLALPRIQARGPRKTLDLAGAVTVTAGLAVLVYGIVSTDVHPWGSARTIVTLAVGLLLLAVFFVTEARFANDPLIPLSVFRRRSLSVANGAAVTLGAGLFGSFFFLSLFLQNVDGYSPLRAGLAFLPLGLVTFLAALIAPRIVTFLGPRYLLMAGLGIAAIGLLWLTQVGAGDSYLVHVFGPQVLLGVGFGLCFLPLTASATAGVPVHEAGLASGLINTTRQLGGALGLAVMATVASSIIATREAARHSTADALTSGYRAAFLIAGCVLVAGVLLAALLSKPAPPPAAAAPAQEPARADEATPGPAPGSPAGIRPAGRSGPD